MINALIISKQKQQRSAFLNRSGIARQDVVVAAGYGFSISLTV